MNNRAVRGRAAAREQQWHKNSRGKNACKGQRRYQSKGYCESAAAATEQGLWQEVGGDRAGTAVRDQRQQESGGSGGGNERTVVVVAETDQPCSTWLIAVLGDFCDKPYWLETPA